MAQLNLMVDFNGVSRCMNGGQGKAEVPKFLPFCGFGYHDGAVVWTPVELDSHVGVAVW